MYLHLGQSVLVRQQEIIGIFDLDNTTASYRTRKFLEQAQNEDRIEAVSEELPKSFVLCQSVNKNAVVYLSQLSPATLRGRLDAAAQRRKSVPVAENTEVILCLKNWN